MARSSAARSRCSCWPRSRRTDVDALERELRRLVQSGLVHRRGFGAQTRYAFKHALIRDAAYDSLLKRERQQLHLRGRSPGEPGRVDPKQTRPEMLALSLRGRKPAREGRGLLARSGAAGARTIGAPGGAPSRARRACGCCKAIPAGPAPRRAGAAAPDHAGCPPSSPRRDSPRRKWSAPTCAAWSCAATSRARFELLYGLFSFYAVQARPDRRLAAGRADAAASPKPGTAPSYRVQSGYGLGAMSFLLGDFEASRRHLAAAFAQDDPDARPASPAIVRHGRPQDVAGLRRPRSLAARAC